jgi:hypothetical protein
MTVVVAAASPVGIVLASDSRTTMLDGSRHRIASDHTRKVFSLFDCIGAATYGIAFIGEKTIDGLIDEFTAEAAIADRPSVDRVATALCEFFSQRLSQWAEENDVELPSAGQWPPRLPRGRLRQAGDRLPAGGRHPKRRCLGVAGEHVASRRIVARPD